MDPEEHGEIEDGTPRVEEAVDAALIAPEPPSVTSAPVSESAPSSTALESEVVAELVTRPNEVILEGPHVVEGAFERPSAIPEPPIVEIIPVAELDPDITALDPELSAELNRSEDEVVLKTAAGEPSPAQAESTELQLAGEVLRASHPALTVRGAGSREGEVAGAAEVCTRTFPAVASSVADARSFATRTLADVPADVLEDIRLMVSELASNAVEHAMTRFHLAIHRSRHEIRVEVTDSGIGTPAMRTPGSDLLKGRGLQIVNILSTGWGVEQKSDTAKTVWFSSAFAPTASA